MGRDNWTPTKWSKLCSAHFEDNQYNRTGKSARLRDDAIPTIFKFTSPLKKKVTRRKKPKSRAMPTDKIESSPCAPVEVITVEVTPAEVAPVEVDPVEVASIEDALVADALVEDSSVEDASVEAPLPREPSPCPTTTNRDHSYYVSPDMIQRCLEQEISKNELIIKKLKAMRKDRCRLLKKIDWLRQVIAELTKKRMIPTS